MAMTEREREMIKLGAAYRNGLAIVFAGAGCFTVGLGFINRDDPEWIKGSAIVVVSLAFSGILHLLALRLLKKLPGPTDAMQPEKP
jgi:hypothetical protein